MPIELVDKNSQSSQESLETTDPNLIHFTCRVEDPSNRIPILTFRSTTDATVQEGESTRPRSFELFDFRSSLLILCSQRQLWKSIVDCSTTSFDFRLLYLSPRSSLTEALVPFTLCFSYDQNQWKSWSNRRKVIQSTIKFSPFSHLITLSSIQTDLPISRIQCLLQEFISSIIYLFLIKKSWTVLFWICFWRCTKWKFMTKSLGNAMDWGLKRRVQSKRVKFFRSSWFFNRSINFSPHF